jgi:hypothetical protein
MFKKNADGDLIGYHIEGGETLELSTHLPLSLGNLVDNKPLFLGYEPMSWYPFHLDKADYKVLEITFSEPKVKEILSLNEFNDLLIYKEFYSLEHMKNICITKLTSAGESLAAEGFDLFCLTKNFTCSGETDLLEAFLINASKYVKQIREISHGEHNGILN